MPSLKELRNRIASVKSTQKITKAMQMVAVSKLRRAQAAVEAARPYAEQVETVLTNLAGAATDGQGPRLLVGSGADQTHLLLVCTGERGLCGAFNTSIVRLARERANALAAQGKTVKILCVGKKGYDQLRRTHEKQILELIDLRAVRTITYDDREADRRQGDRAVRERRVRRLHAVLLALQVGDLADPDRPAAHSARARREGGERADLRLRAGRGRNPHPAAAARGRRCASIAPCLKIGASFFGAQMSAMDNATRNAGEMVKKYTLRYNRTRQAMITKELIEIISGAEAL